MLRTLGDPGHEPGLLWGQPSQFGSDWDHLSLQSDAVRPVLTALRDPGRLGKAPTHQGQPDLRCL